MYPCVNCSVLFIWIFFWVLHFVNLYSRVEKHLFRHGPRAYHLILSPVAYHAMFIRACSTSLKKKNKLLDKHRDTYFMPPHWFKIKSLCLRIFRVEIGVFFLIVCVWRSLSGYVLCTLCWWKPGKCPSHGSFAFRSPVPGLPDGPQNVRHVLGHFAFHASVISGTSILLSQGATLKHMQRKTNEFFLPFLFSSSPFSICWELSMCQVSTLELEEMSELSPFWVWD